MRRDKILSGRQSFFIDIVDSIEWIAMAILFYLRILLATLELQNLFSDIRNKCNTFILVKKQFSLTLTLRLTILYIFCINLSFTSRYRGQLIVRKMSLATKKKSRAITQVAPPHRINSFDTERCICITIFVTSRQFGVFSERLDESLNREHWQLIITFA